MSHLPLVHRGGRVCPVSVVMGRRTGPVSGQAESVEPERAAIAPRTDARPCPQAVVCQAGCSRAQFLNSIVVSVATATALVGIGIAIPAAYALARIAVHRQAKLVCARCLPRRCFPPWRARSHSTCCSTRSGCSTRAQGWCFATRATVGAVCDLSAASGIRIDSRRDRRSRHGRWRHTLGRRSCKVVLPQGATRK